MPSAEVRNRVRRVVEEYSQHERMLDALWQWATNPTPPSAGFAWEENCGFIATNLFVRYGKASVDVAELSWELCVSWEKELPIPAVQEAMIAEINGPLGACLRHGILRRLADGTPGRRALSAWLVSRSRWCAYPGSEEWIAGEQDWSLGMDLERAARDLSTPLGRMLHGSEDEEVDLVREALRVGVVNRLLYRNKSQRERPHLRAGPRTPVDLIAY